MTTPRTWGLLATIGVVSLVLVVLPGTARPAFPSSNGRIAFASERDGAFEIYTMNADGSDPTRLTTNPADDREPAWSPDGSEIAFARNFEIYVMNADGTGAPTQLTHNSGGGDQWPTWSPDGSKIAFTSYGSPFGAVFVVNRDGSPPTRLTDNPNTNDFDPAWSPDGSKIAFVSDRNVFFDIYVMNAAPGSPQIRLTTDPANDSDPVWSPNGSKIAFSSLRDGNSEIYVMNAEDPTVQTRITNNAATDAYPTWSPDGQKIAFTRGRSFDAEIYVVNADGTGEAQLTDSDERDDYPDWQAVAAPPPPSGPCVVLSKTSVAISGTASTPSTRRRVESEHLSVSNCGDSAVHLNARGTNATGQAGTWQLTNDSSGGSVCGVGVNVFRADLTLWLNGGQAATPLSTSNTPLVGADGATPFSLGAAADQELSAGVDLPCVGSVGLGDPMTTNVTLTAAVP